jgi:hypothetical protein
VARAGITKAASRYNMLRSNTPPHHYMLCFGLDWPFPAQYCGGVAQSSIDPWNKVRRVGR